MGKQAQATNRPNFATTSRSDHWYQHLPRLEAGNEDRDCTTDSAEETSAKERKRGKGESVRALESMQ